MNPIVLLAAAYGSGNIIPQLPNYKIKFEPLLSDFGISSYADFNVYMEGSVSSPLNVEFNSYLEPPGSEPCFGMQLIATGTLYYSFTMTSGLINSYAQLYDICFGTTGISLDTTSYSGITVSGTISSLGYDNGHYLIMKFHNVDGPSALNIVSGSFYIS